MRRIIMMLTVVSVMAAMILASTLPVFAQGKSESAPNCEKGNNQAFFGPGINNRDPQASESLDKNQFGPHASAPKERGAYCQQP